MELEQAQSAGHGLGNQFVWSAKTFASILLINVNRFDEAT